MGPLLAPARLDAALARDVGRAWGGFWSALLARSGLDRLASASTYLMGGEPSRQKQVREVVARSRTVEDAVRAIASSARDGGWTVAATRPDFLRASANDATLFVEPDPETLGVLAYVIEPRAVTPEQLVAFTAEAEELRALAPFVERFGEPTTAQLRARAERAPVGVVEIALDLERVLVDGRRVDHEWLAAHGFEPDGACLRRGRVFVEDRGGSTLVYLGAMPELAGGWPATERD